MNKKQKQTRILEAIEKIEAGICEFARQRCLAYLKTKGIIP